MGLTVVTAPTLQPVTLAEMRDWLRLPVSYTGENALLDGLIAASTNFAMTYMDRQLMPATMRWTLDRFPWPNGVLRLPRPPHLEIVSIKYFDTNNALQTWAAENYQVDLTMEPARLAPVFGQTWPQVGFNLDAVQIEFRNGYIPVPGDPDVSPAIPSDPRGNIEENIKTGIKMLAAELFKNRAESITGTIISNVPRGPLSLFDQYCNPNQF